MKRFCPGLLHDKIIQEFITICLAMFVTFTAPNPYCGQPLLEHFDPLNSFLILLNLENDLSSEQLVTIRIKNKDLSVWIN